MKVALLLILISNVSFATILSKDFGIGLTSEGFKIAVEKIQNENGDQMGFELDKGRSNYSSWILK
jgi:hypothetical protein